MRLVATGVAVLIAAGCLGHARSAESEYRSRANALCRERVARQEQLGPRPAGGGGTAAWRAYVEKSTAIAQDVNRQLLDLQVPASMERSGRKLRRISRELGVRTAHMGRASRRLVADLTRVPRKTLEARSARITAEEHDLFRLIGRLDELLREMGLDDCTVPVP